MVGSTTAVRRGGLSYRGEARGRVLERSRGRNRVPSGGGGVCGGSTKPVRRGGGRGATGARPAESDRG